MFAKDYIKQIANLQSGGEGVFDKGLFPAYRKNKIIGYSRPDTTLFFTAITAFTLLKIRHLVDEDSQKLIDQIAEKTRQTYSLFQNKDGLKTYNFWKTRPSKHFPNGFIFRHFDHFRIPDDADDTAFVYLTSNPSDDELLWIKQKLAAHANLTKQNIRNTYPEYKHLTAYSTWFGKNMYVEFDVCVLSNVLYMIFEYKLPINQHDTDSLAYVKSVIASDRYITEPFKVAHQYPRTAWIAYHVARLLATFEPDGLQSVRQKFIDDLQKLYAHPHPIFDQLLLATSLLRFGIKKDFDCSKISDEDIQNHSFFIAGLLTAYENRWLYKLARLPLFHIYWHSEAHALALMAEYEALRSR